MHRWSLLVAGWFLVPAVAFAQQAVRELPVSLQLDIDTHGQVAAVKAMDPPPMLVTMFGHTTLQPPAQAPLPPALEQAVAQVASKWRFQPLVVAGRAVTGRTWAQATLQVTERGDGTFNVALRYGRNGPYMETPAQPQYPLRMLRLARSGSLAVEYTVQPDGAIDHLQVLKAFGAAAEHQRLFRDAIGEALARSRALPLMIDGRAVTTRVRTSYVFTTNLTKAEADRLGQQAMEVVDATASSKPDPQPLTSGEVVAVDSPFVMQPSG